MTFTLQPSASDSATGWHCAL